jgi:BirA family biotin operon repressor/biotin-[acetyl-CoA-carboxylase] ligase
VLREKSGAETGLKWPNDLMVESGKVGGVLVEASGEVVVVGLGVNLWWPEPPDGIAAIHENDPGPDAAAILAAAWAQRVLERLSREARAWGHDDYRAACVTLGNAVTWEPDGRGIAVDIAADGGLVVETPAGRTTLRSGEVHAVRATTLAAEPTDTAGGTAE